ncbi:hypothetical protein [Mesorhizobium salmacidum]|uniref:Uncharacterized protein n=1 Tax=Mesorhizobium salmacidum TaxID=3015171 RepID=A0ABU8KTL9_9HYPH
MIETAEAEPEYDYTAIRSSMRYGVEGIAIRPLLPWSVGLLCRQHSNLGSHAEGA